MAWDDPPLDVAALIAREGQPVVRSTPDGTRARSYWRCELACGCVQYLDRLFYWTAPSKSLCPHHPYRRGNTR